MEKNTKENFEIHAEGLEQKGHQRDIKSNARLSLDISPKNKYGVTPRGVLALRGLLFP